MTGLQRIIMPRGAKLLAAQPENGVLQLRALCDDDTSFTERAIAIYRDGDLITDDDPGVYIDTFQMRNGQLVGHVFDLGEYSNEK